MFRLPHRTAISAGNTRRIFNPSSSAAASRGSKPLEGVPRMIDRKIGLASVLLLLLAAVLVTGQTATATISGVVKDERGAVIANAGISLKNIATGVWRETTTDGQGNYNLFSLQPGEYEIRCAAQGFKSITREGLALKVGGSSVLDLTLPVGELGTEVVVAASDPLLEPAKVELSRVVETREIESLPISGRNFVDFAKLAGGVAPGRENVTGGGFKEPDIAVGVAAVPRLTFAGQSELYNMIQVDGVDNIQTVTGLPRATPSQEAVREFRILTSTFLAEYGRTLGGFVNIVTKSGTNQFTGSLYYFGMNDKLNARSILNGPSNNVLRQNQYGATLGGPVQRERTFFFANYEGQRRAESNRFSQAILSNLSAINVVRRRFGLTPEVIDQVRTNDYNQFLVKLDHKFNTRFDLSFRYNFLDSTTHNFLGGGGRASAAPSTVRDNLTRDQSLVLNSIGVLSHNLVNEARVQLARKTFDFPAVHNEPALEISNLIIMGKSTSDVDFYKENRVQLADNLSYAANRHQFKMGVDFNRLGDQTIWKLFFPARIIFPNLDAFFTMSPSIFQWPYLNTATATPTYSTTWDRAVPPEWNQGLLFSMTHNSYGLFWQDQWRASTNLNLTYGLRYDLETAPREFLKPDRNNFQPRVGLSYAYGRKGVLRAGYGIFHGRIGGSIGQLFVSDRTSSRADQPNAQLLFPDVALISGKLYQFQLTGASAPAAAVTFLTTGQLPPPGTFGFTDNLNTGIRTPYAQQASLQVSQELRGGLLLSLSYLYVHALKITAHTANLNAVGTGLLPSGKLILAGRKFPANGNFFVQDDNGYSIYHGGMLEVEKRYGRQVSFHGTYTFSKTISNTDSLANNADYPEGLDPRLERALSRQHVGQRFTLSFLSQLPKTVSLLHDFKLGSIVSLESGRHFNIFAGADFNRDGNPLSDRPGLLGRNTLRGPMFASVDARIARDVRFNERLQAELTLDFFNLLNHVNIKDLNTVWGNSDLNTPPILSFKTPRDVFNPRQLQFGIKLRF
jgi:hypothetical protein